MWSALTVWKITLMSINLMLELAIERVEEHHEIFSQEDIYV